ncbi:hypothetical protein [Pseudoduganella sp.]|uniref:hypothetical protein n=1 Tax=Pseudoduganella sp. TaxID=1880898 RepID=UPI0035AEFD4C
MTTTASPPSSRQVSLLALILFAPLSLTAWALLATSPKPAGLATVAVIAVGFVAILYFIVARHAVELTPSRLKVKHSLYTFSLERSEVSALRVSELASADQIGLALRTNGVAGFGYLSGWFRRVGNEKIFCAVSQGPLWLLTFEGSAGCRQLALSASAETVRRIEEWARQG